MSSEKSKIKRRKFLGQIALGTGVFVNDVPWNIFADLNIDQKFEEPLFDWSSWQKYRKTVHHPCLTIKQKDIFNARNNAQQYEWAKNYFDNIEKTANFYLSYIDDQVLESLITETTPGHTRMTPCPACRDKGLPVHPAGFWTWDISQPEIIECKVCGTVFPNDDYPETIHLKSNWRHPQTISYYGGEPFEIFGFKQGRPSFTGNIRVRKVRWTVNYCRLLAEAFILTDKPEYAFACKKILSRLANCFPNWMVHVGYGEYADMDPRIAAMHIHDLPEDELTPPPNKPDRQLWTGYWSAGRWTGRGLDATFVRKVAEAYDLTCTAQDGNGDFVYSDAERITIERDLLLESTILLVCDKSINNKSVSNHTAVGLVGMCVGHPELVRFGLEGFDKVMDEWFLSDGATKESPFYGLMTLGGIWDLAQSIRDYSDPEGYLDSSWNRIDGLNLYENDSFQRVWEAFYQGLQGNLTYPPWADSFPDLILDPSYVELMVANYPEKRHYLALMKVYCGSDLSKPTGPVPDSYYKAGQDKVDMVLLSFPYDLSRASSPSSFSVYYRKPGIGGRSSEPVHFDDWNPKELRIGHLRTGIHGRESLLLLNASHWRGHNNLDSLNLYYWKKGSTILTDFGYLWDHPEKPMSARTLAHNTVLINEKNQLSKERGGNMRYFNTSPNVKMMEAESSAYAEASLYRRTTAIIDHGEGRSYVVDFFRVKGGEIQDYVFHLEHTTFKMSDPSSWKQIEGPLYDFNKIKRASELETWRIQWPVGQKMQAQGWMMKQKEEQCYISEGRGQKDWENSDIGARATYVVRRCKGEGLKTFVSVYEGSDSGEFFVKNVQYDHKKNLLTINTPAGTDYLMSALDNKKMEIVTEAGDFNLEGHFAAVSIQDGKKKWELVQEV